jgi:hypothetical protein
MISFGDIAYRFRISGPHWSGNGSLVNLRNCRTTVMQLQLASAEIDFIFIAATYLGDPLHQPLNRLRIFWDNILYAIDL